MNHSFAISAPLRGTSLAARLAALVQRTLFALSTAEDTAGQRADQAILHQKAEHLLDAYGNSVLRCAYTLLHNWSDAEEILQETLIRFLTTAPILESPQHEKAWLLRVAANLSKNRLAYNSLRRTDELREDLIAQGREDLSFVWDAVGQLPPRCRSAIHLYYHEGLSTAQIAEILGAKESTVRSDLHRGRKKLKELLKGAYDFDEPL